MPSRCLIVDKVSSSSGALAHRKPWRPARASPGPGSTPCLLAPEPGDTNDREASDQLLGVVTDALHANGLDGETAVDAVRALRAMLHGFASQKLAGGFGLPQSIDRS